jgi:MFS family permease
VFHGGPQAVGYLYAAPGVGALVGALTTGWVGGVRRQGRAVIIAVMVLGVAIAGFGATNWLPLALLLLAVAGSARGNSYPDAYWAFSRTKGREKGNCAVAISRDPLAGLARARVGPLTRSTSTIEGSVKGHKSLKSFTLRRLAAVALR